MIQLFHVTKRYGNDAPALTDVTVQIERGEFVFVTGPSGAGKSTLFKLLFCAERATDGQILVNGRNIARIRDNAVPYLRRNIGVVFQDFKLLPNRSAAENVAYTLHVLGMRRREIRRRVGSALQAVGLAHRMDYLPPRLSGGEQQRVAIARALAGDPAILLADEPTGNLDAELTLEIMNLLMEVNARGTTVVVATHDRGLMEHFRKRTLVLERGRLVSDRI